MTTTEELKNFYVRCMSCDNTHKKCPSILKDNNKGYVPRGFYFEPPYFKSPRKILVVANNPGKLAKGEEKQYENKKELKLVNAHLKVQRRLEERSNFHKKLKGTYLPEILNLPRDKIFNHSALTNLVKCSAKTGGMLAEFDPTVEECFRKWFLEELQLLKPKVILALGKPTERFLKKKSDEMRIPSECIIYVKHPSRGGYSRESEGEELRKIKEKLENV